MKNNHRLLALLIHTFVLFFSVDAQANTTWKTIQPGLEYTLLRPDYIHPWAKIRVFRFDLQHYRLGVTLAKDYNNPTTTVQELVEKEKALIGVNGGFFTPNFQPIGLRISNGKIRTPLQKTSWWGIFYIQDGNAYLTSQKNYQPKSNIQFAVQGGPRLVVDGEIPPLKSGIAERTAIGIDKTGRVILLATDNTPMSTEDLAEIIRAPQSEDGLDIINALNLDGGSSTQLFARIGDFKVKIPGYGNVTDAVLVLAK